IFRMRWAPDGGEYLLVGQDLSGVAREKEKKFKLFRRQLDLLAGSADPMSDIVDFQVAQLENGRFSFSLHPMTKCGPHARQQFTDAERFVDEIIGAKIERLNLLDLPIACRKNDDRYV